MIKEAKRRGDIIGAWVAVDLFITHVLLVDDMLLFCNSSRRGLATLKDVPSLFPKVTGMLVNIHKSYMSPIGFLRAEELNAQVLLPFQSLHLMQVRNIWDFI